jgi:olefin beta-lactone synthetase
VSDSPTAPAALPPRELPGLDPSWSRLVEATDADGVVRSWHVLDTGEVSAATADGPDGDPDGGEPLTGTLLCVHGNPTWSYLWRELLAQAPRGWRVIAVDQLEMGFSERTGIARGLQRRIDDLGGLTEALGLEGPVVTVAHDWGGPVSLGWALAHKEQLAGVVLTNTAVHQPEGSPAPTLIRMARRPGVLDASTVRTRSFIRGALALAHPSLPREVHAAYHAPYETTARRHGIGGFVRDIPLDPAHPSAPALDAVANGIATLHDVPVLLLWGPNDPVFSDLYLHDLEARLPHASVHRFSGASHMVVEDADIAGTVDTWLAATLGQPAEAETADASNGRGGHVPDREPLWAAMEDPTRSALPAIVEMPSTERSGIAARLARADAPVPLPTVMSFGELARHVQHLAAGLADDGVASGDRVALLVTPGIELATAIFACWRIGAVAVVVDAGLGAKGITRALKSAAPDHLIGIPRALLAARTLGWPGRRIAAGNASERVRRLTATATSLPQLRTRGASLPVPPTPGPDAEAAIVFTSGATGASKGVVYRHRQLQAQRDALMATYGIRPDDRLVAAFAPFAIYGPTMGITSVVPDMEVTAPRTLEAQALADAAAAIGATLVFASPAALVNVVATAGDLDPSSRDALAAVRLLMSAGAPIPPVLLRKLGAVMPNAEPHTPYGMTEALPVADISLAGIEEAGPGDGVCVGPPVVGVDVAISPVDARGRAEGALTTEPRITGEICVRADHVKDRYDRLYATERASSRNPGWHRSGDIGHLDDEGRLWVEGRSIHTITTANGVVTPVGIERRVEGIAHIRLAAAVGIGPVGTQQIVVVVSTDPVAPNGGLAPRTLTAAVRRTLDVPVAAVLVCPDLPVDIRHNSKIDRTRLATWAGKVLAGQRAGTP